jgi:hypothetical protein
VVAACGGEAASHVRYSGQPASWRGDVRRETMANGIFFVD